MRLNLFHKSILKTIGRNPDDFAFVEEELDYSDGKASATSGKIVPRILALLFTYKGSCNELKVTIKKGARVQVE